MVDKKINDMFEQRQNTGNICSVETWMLASERR